MAERKRLGERLLERGVISEGQLADALRAQQVTGEELGTALLRLSYVQEDDLMRLLSEDAGIPFIDLTTTQPERAAVRAVTRPAVMIHAVSLGEINATRALVAGGPVGGRDKLCIYSGSTLSLNHHQGQALAGSYDPVGIIAVRGVSAISAK